MSAYVYNAIVNSDQLTHELMVFLAQTNVEYDTEIELVSIDTAGGEVTITLSEALPDQAAVDALWQLVSAHVPVSEYVPPEQQANVNTLIGYLNSGTPSVANAARTQMILALAPRLPPDLIAIIVTNTAAIVGF